ncbi:MAG: RHS repeat protein, partial [bacterium]|nr:RHS repeat protein [bacterium]
MKQHTRRMGALALGTVIMLSSGPVYGEDSHTIPGGNLSKTRKALPGSPRAWEAGMGVGTATSVNLRNGNLLTAIPLLGWSGRGPSLTVGLYHNSAGINEDNSTGPGFDMGPGWTISYGGFIMVHDEDAIVVDSDGTRSWFNFDGQQWNGDPGDFRRLEDLGSGWRITHRDQTYQEYGNSGRMIKVVDASGNELTIHRDSQNGWRIDSIEDASGRTVTFGYDGADRLTTITDDGLTRSWTLAYDAGSGRLSEIRDPMYGSHPSPHFWGFGYDDDGRIVSLADKEGDAFTYTYSQGKLSRAYDPGALSSQYQRWQFSSFKEGSDPFTNYRGKTRYTDRRGHVWTLIFDNANNLIEFSNPFSQATQLTYGANHLLDRHTDPMGRWWEYVHDAAGNVTSITDQYSRAVHWTYDSLNNVTSHTDAAGNTWYAEYTDVDNPTAITAVREPPASPGGPEAVTTASYFDASFTPPDLPAGAWDGLIDTVTDPLGVTTRWEYDQWGQVNKYVEGGSAARAGGMTMNYESNSAGWPLGSYNEDMVECQLTFVIYFDDEGNVTAAGCPLVWCKKSQPAASPMSHDRPYGIYSAEYDGMGRVESVNNSVFYHPENWSGLYDSRETHLTYDDLGRPLTHLLTTDESGHDVQRLFDSIYNDTSGIYTVGGSDGTATVTTLDAANRPLTVQQGTESAAYTYCADGRLESVIYSNGASTWYTYDFENLRMNIDHYNGAATPQMILGLEYAFTVNGLVESITEYDQ